MTADWLSIGGQRWRLPARVTRLSDRTLQALGGATSRLTSDTWIRYDIDLAATPAPPEDAALIPVTDGIMALLRQHPDREHNQLQSGFRFWQHGLRRAFLWQDEQSPLCIQWLLTEEDNALLHHYTATWRGMYPPLPAGCGQVENLFAFSTARRKGVASQFEFLMYEEARRRGLSRLITHIHADNVPANAWAARTGWRAYGTIRRYVLDLPGMQDRAIYVHGTQGDTPDRRATQAAGGRPSRVDAAA